MRTNAIPIMHAMLKEYIKEEMKQGTYEEIPFQPLVIMSYDNSEVGEIMDMDSDMDMDDLLVCLITLLLFELFIFVVVIIYLYEIR